MLMLLMMPRDAITMPAMPLLERFAMLPPPRC